jgi:hypothetical protein
MARMTDAQVFEHVGLTREQIVAAIKNVGKPQLVEVTPRTRPRPKCLICGNHINKYNCRPTRQKKGARK